MTDPAACARAKKAARLEREAAPLKPRPEPETPEEYIAEAWRQYRRHTRPFRRVFRGIISRKEAERFVKVRLARQTRAAERATEVEGQG